MRVASSNVNPTLQHGRVPKLLRLDYPFGNLNFLHWLRNLIGF